jgi:hypothetical protein
LIISNIDIIRFDIAQPFGIISEFKIFWFRQKSIIKIPVKKGEEVDFEKA